MHKHDLQTPCLILDMDRLEGNLERMRSKVENTGKSLRPHVKTHKCSQLAKLQLEAGAIGLCAAKLSEAELLVDQGLHDVLLTSPVVAPDRVQALADLVQKSPSLMVVVDNLGNIEQLDDALQRRGLSMRVLLDLDVGLNRTGVHPDAAPLFFEKLNGCSALALAGIQAYAGHVQHIHSYQARKEASLQCMHTAARVFRQINAEDPSCEILSGTGTGTFDIDIEVPELTELQVGSYVFMDAEYLEIGSAEDEAQFTAFQPALRLLTRVVSDNHRDEGFVTVDAGLKSLYHHGATPRVLFPESTALSYEWFGDEYGRITSDDPKCLPEYGSSVELVTSHCDPTVNLFDDYFLVRKHEVVGTWRVDMRGCSQ